MSNTYTQEQIDRAIEALEIYANDQNLDSEDMPFWDPSSVDDADDLTWRAWCSTDDNSDAGPDIGYCRADALEAAARLRDGLLPGTPAWLALEESDDEDPGIESDDEIED